MRSHVLEFELLTDIQDFRMVSPRKRFQCVARSVRYDRKFYGPGSSGSMAIVSVM
jgi:hypothetical protein